MPAHRVLMNVSNVLRIIATIPDAMIMKSLLPDLHVRAKLLLRAKGNATFDELDCFLQACQGRHKNMDMVGHDSEFMQKIGGTSVVIQSVDEKSRPSIGVEKRTTSPGFRRDHVGLPGISRVLSIWPQPSHLRG